MGGAYDFNMSVEQNRNTLARSGKFLALSLFSFGGIATIALINSYMSFRPIADDYGNIAIAYQLGFLDYSLKNISESNSSIFAVLLTAIYFYLAAMLPWSVAYIPLVVTFLLILLFLTIRLGTLFFGSLKIRTGILALPFVFTVWAASLTTFGTTVEFNHFYSVFGWLSNSPRFLFAWLTICLILFTDFRSKARRNHYYVSYFILGVALATLGVVESAVFILTITSLGLFQHNFNVRSLFSTKIFLSNFVGAITGLMFIIFGPGSQNRAESSAYAINSPSQIIYITAGEFAKHWGETVGNFVYALIIALSVLLTALYLRLNSAPLEENLKFMKEQQVTHQLIKQKLFPMIVLWLSLSLLTAFSSAFVYSAPWHVIGVRQVFFVIAVILGVYLGVLVRSFSLLFGIFASLLIVVILIAGPIRMGISQIGERNSYWLLGPSPYGYMTDRESQWVYDGALQLAPIVIERGKEYPSLEN